MRLFPLIVCFLMLNNAIAQEGKELKAGNKYLADGNFEVAMEHFQEVLAINPENEKANYLMGVCYLNTNIDKSKAVPYLRKSLNIKRDGVNAHYLLGRAYLYELKFDSAITYFTKYKSLGGGTAASLKEAAHQMEYAQHGKELIKFKLNVSFENLGPNVNTVFPDYFPFAPADESFLMFNSKRDDGSEMNPDGHFKANIYFSEEVAGKFKKAEPVEALDTDDSNEEVVGMTTDGKHLIYFEDHPDEDGELYYGSYEDGKFTKPIKLDENINHKSHEIAACLSADESKIYFASDRKGGLGGTDIYVSNKLPIGGWGPPINLGPGVNTEQDEDFPNLSSDGKTLYFSSKGHTSMGGYDIFSAHWHKENGMFDHARNVGYPINTPYDDMNLRLSETERYGYISAVRPGGFGDLDIYRVTFNEVAPKYTVIKGKILSDVAGKSTEDAFISITDNKTGDVYGDYLPNLETMKFVIILPPGEYSMMIDCTGFQPFDEVFTVYDKASYSSVIRREIKLISD